MIEPIRAPVRPRVRKQPSGEVVLLEDVVAKHLAVGESRVLILSGEVGAGTTIAAQHLAKHFIDQTGLQFEICSTEYESPRDGPLVRIGIHTDRPDSLVLHHYQLVGWGRDEGIHQVDPQRRLTGWNVWCHFQIGLTVPPFAWVVWFTHSDFKTSRAAAIVVSISSSV